MTLKQYVDKLNQFLAEHPEYGCLTTVSTSEHHDRWEDVIMERPALVHVTGDSRDWFDADLCREMDLPINAVVIN